VDDHRRPVRAQDPLDQRAVRPSAITRAQHDPITREYLARKQREGKTKRGAMRCLKRYLARRVHHLLSLPPLTLTDDERDTSPEIPPRPHDGDVEQVTAAPALMLCIA